MTTKAGVRSRQVSNGKQQHSPSSNNHSKKNGKSTPSPKGASSSNNHNSNSSKSPEKRHSVHLNDHQKEEIDSLVVWKRPFQTLYYASHQLFYLLRQLLSWFASHAFLCCAISSVITIFLMSKEFDGPHQVYVKSVYSKVLWCGWWVFLGVLSSVGLGTGLHTFLLYLGPHIARVTLAAYECNSLNFPQPPYPEEIICPDSEDGGIDVWSIMGKVRLEAFMWGAGTALGELPPYFISRAHRLAGDSQDEMLEEFEELEDLAEELNGSAENGSSGSLKQKKKHSAPQSLAQRVKTAMIHFMKKMGFVGILACASIPNPLFDLAGIICGYSLISFWTFFGATLLGKAVIKMHIQKLVVIIVFNERYVESVLEFSKNIPYLGKSVHGPLRDYLQSQKMNLHRGASHSTDAKSGSWIGFLFESFVLLMILYFLVSIINSMAQSNLKHRLQSKQQQQQQQHDKKRKKDYSLKKRLRND